MGRFVTGRRVGIAAGALGVAVVAAGIFWTPVVSREDSAVEWALRLPKEREAARTAGFVRGKYPVPKMDPATNAAPAWKLLDAQIRANEDSGKLPSDTNLLRYADPIQRPKQDRKKVAILLRKYRKFLPEARRIAAYPAFYTPYRYKSRRGEEQCEIFCAGLLLADALDKCDRRDDRGAIKEIGFVLQIARQLQSLNSDNADMGQSLEIVTARLVRGGLTDPDAARRRRFLAAFAPKHDRFLRPMKEEPTPAEQINFTLRDDFHFVSDLVHKKRVKKYKPHKGLFADAVPLISFLDRLDFQLSQKMAADALESVTDWQTAGVAVQVRRFSKETRPYPFWKAMQTWDKRAAQETRDDYKGLSGWSFADAPKTRLNRDTERALTEAVFAQVSGSNAPFPEDPYAPTPGTPLHWRNLPGGVVMWYSIGANGKDDGGDFQKDRTVRVSATETRR